MLDQPAGRGTILLVEDEPFVALVAQQVLEDHGFAVVVAAHGAAALAHVDPSRLEPSQITPAQADHGAAGNPPPLGEPRAPLAPVLAVVDLGLPDMDGADVVRALRRHLPDLPIVIATGYATDEIEAEFAGTWGLAIIRKPYDVSTLRTTLRGFGIAFPDE